MLREGDISDISPERIRKNLICVSKTPVFAKAIEKLHVAKMLVCSLGF